MSCWFTRWNGECLKAVVECCKELKEVRWSSSGSAISEEMRMAAVAERYPHLRLTAEDYEEYYDSEDDMDFDLFY